LNTDIDQSHNRALSKYFFGCRVGVRHHQAVLPTPKVKLQQVHCSFMSLKCLLLDFELMLTRGVFESVFDGVAMHGEPQQWLDS